MTLAKRNVTSCGVIDDGPPTYVELLQVYSFVESKTEFSHRFCACLLVPGL